MEEGMIWYENYKEFIEADMWLDDMEGF